MRIRDWSSNVCSSDLNASGNGRRDEEDPQNGRIERPWRHVRKRRNGWPRRYAGRRRGRGDASRRPAGSAGRRCAEAAPWIREISEERTEEHTSELQSLMRISYAVFCSKKRKATTQ